MTKRPKVLITYPNFHRYFVPFLPFYEPLVAILLGTLVKDMADVKLFDRRYDSEREWIKTIKEFKPDLIAVRIHTSGEIFTTKRMLDMAKEIHPSVITIIGGQHPTLLPDDFDEPYCDLICIGPGEETFPEVVKAIANGTPFDDIKGLAIRKASGFVLTPERPIKSGVFSWPKLDRSLAAKYKGHFVQGITVTTHGCPHRCKFCSLWFTARGTYRLRDPEEVADDIASLPNEHIYIADDNTFHDYDHAVAMYEALKRRGVKKFYGAYARTDTIAEHPDIFEKWKEIGLRALVVGFEVVSQNELDVLNKKTSLDNNIKSMEILNKLNIYCYAHFIIFPHFTVKDFKDLKNFIKEHHITQPYFVPLTPTPGTILFKEAKDKKELSIYNYGFYNLEYMVYKTALPKWRFYCEYVKLWLSSISPAAYLLWMRKHMSFITYLYRIAIIMRVMPAYFRNVIEQIAEENATDYEAIKDKLPPSLQDGYKFRFMKDYTEE